MVTVLSAPSTPTMKLVHRETSPAITIFLVLFGIFLFFTFLTWYFTFKINAMVSFFLSNASNFGGIANKKIQARSLYLNCSQWFKPFFVQ